VSEAPRLRAGTILALAALSVLPLVGLAPSCSTAAVGVEACRSIESARCDALVSCPKEQHGFTADQAEACKLFYRDDCLHGIENNADGGVVMTEGECAKAIAATAACAKAGAKTMAGCAGAALVTTANAAAVSPCDMLAGSVVGNTARVAGVELLADCSFVVKVPVVDGGSTSASVSSGSSSSAAGGGASSSASSGSLSSASSSTASSSSASSSAAGGGGGPADASPE
jgi:hypothetical protein